ncbi:ABC-2 family transporter protein [Reinekea sp.]|jgi:ABC-2 type transport system permease protein|uniref:ABC-2 family transporter protein n=1 Tax=Reinekea sp. TaxID=1970455 RepID=UPI00257B5057|nr:ABC-2 family transporter protein [Reinekea sp.]
MIKLLKIGLQQSMSMAKKSPANFWLSALINLTYYIAQGMFWLVLNQHDSFSGFMNQRYILFFFVTIALTDNLFLLIFGQSGMELERRVKTYKLDVHLLLPVNLPFYYVVTTISMHHAILTAVSLLAFFFIHWLTHSSLWLITVHLLLIVQGTIVLAAITWIYRCSTFWSNALVNVRNSNPCFKVLIRPLESFSGVVRLIFLFIIPCLFITGVPAFLVAKSFLWPWFLAQSMVTIFLVWLANWIFILGTQRYGRVVT